MTLAIPPHLSNHTTYCSPHFTSVIPPCKTHFLDLPAEPTVLAIAQVLAGVFTVLPHKHIYIYYIYTFCDYILFAPTYSTQTMAEASSSWQEAVGVPSRGKLLKHDRNVIDDAKERARAGTVLRDDMLLMKQAADHARAAA